MPRPDASPTQAAAIHIDEALIAHPSPRRRNPKHRADMAFRESPARPIERIDVFEIRHDGRRRRLDRRRSGAENVKHTLKPRAEASPVNSIRKPLTKWREVRGPSRVRPR